MSEGNEEKKTLSLGKGTLSLKGPASVQARQNMGGQRGSRGGVPVEVRRKRMTRPQDEAGSGSPSASQGGLEDLHHLTAEERQARARALREALAESERRKAEEARRKADEAETADAGAVETAPADEGPLPEDELRRRELEELSRIEEEERRKAEEAEKSRADVISPVPPASQQLPARRPGVRTGDREEDEGSVRDRLKRGARTPAPRRSDADRRRGKLTVTKVLNDDYDRERGPSLAAQRRAREKARLAAMGSKEPAAKVFREVVLPETITVQELSNRMAERGADVIKSLMKMGVMATINQTIDADTAELVIGEFGHKVRRVTDADVEVGLAGEEDRPEDRLPRPPVVTIMGHVDHGKTSLLDALRETDVVSGEAGGITQHIGAYQVVLRSGAKITFLDTPGHAAFTEMRARGANVTDIVVLVVAADDSLMPQTIEAINHAKAAGVPMIVAVNKIDLPDANPGKVKQDLLQHEVVVEEMGGDVLCLEVSAKKKVNLDKLEEAILLQSEILELSANPDRAAEGVIVESRQEVGRGSVATVLIQRGTLKLGDIFVAGAEWGRVRALFDDRGNSVEKAVPGQPVGVLGLQGTPDAGDKFVVVGDESRAREISEYRQRKRREAQAAIAAKKRTTLEDLLQQAREGEKATLPVVIKGDVHGSVEAITGSLTKLTEESTEISVTVLHSGVGGITESDVILAKASGGIIIGFNVRANPQARDMAQRDGVEIRYYNVIYDVIDDARAILTGLLSPELREVYLGQAEIRQVFNITKTGKVAGCMITHGNVQRGAKVRLLRDDVVIHEGKLKTLRRFKDEVKEVKEGMECGIAFENYDDIKEGDIVECFDVVEKKREL
ncbi:MAG: translation initiation factor IF-2 [Alphaproteobacteria bacterium]|nr:translation initiation factor IF-2 [Alphaproteobacteria bacterium]